MAARHINIPIFIPHLGCPNKCVFCNQRTISGVDEFDLNGVRATIDEALSTADGAECEIAFFGGSFTGIDRELMISLLEIAKEYLDSGKVSALRCSTRPDYIDEDILDILELYRVETVELGLQSSTDEVLRKCKRGHTHEDEKRAVELLYRRGFNFVGQMMIGLPGSALADELATAKFIIDSHASGARIYPTVVFRDTELCEMAMLEEYRPLSLDEAVSRSAAVLKLFIEAGVSVVRIGLCASENLVGDDTYFAGPNHPALGELVESELYYEHIKRGINALGKRSECIRVEIARGALSKAIGQRKKNRIRLLSDFPWASITFVESEALAGYSVNVIGEERKHKCT